MVDHQQLLPLDATAIGDVLAQWRARWPAMGVLALLPEAEQGNLPCLQSACRDQGVPLVGGIFPALIDGGGFAAGGVWLLRFNRMPPRFLLADINGAAEGAVRQLVAATADRLGDETAGAAPPLLFLVFDGMLPNIATLLAGVYGEIRGRVSYAGVNAGSETFRPLPCLFDSERVVGGGVLGLLLPGATRVAVRHDYPVAETLLRATSTVGNRIIKIDGRPAFEVYREVIAAEYQVAVTHENFYDHAVHFPFGVVLATDVVVRIPVAFNDDGSIFCVGEVPPNSALRLLRAPAAGKSRCVEDLAESLGPVGGLPLTAFYCAGRRLHFGAQAADEVVRLQALTGVSAIAGALTLGEIDCMAKFGFPRFHNAAIVCLAPGAAVAAPE